MCRTPSHRTGLSISGPPCWDRGAACPLYRLSLQGIGVQRNLAADKSNLKLLKLAAEYQHVSCRRPGGTRKPLRDR